MRSSLLTVLVCIVTGLINPVAAQQQIFKNYTVNDGLVSNTIRQVYQDAKGFLWIGTLEGLSKYDGHSFTNYSIANGLSHNMVNDFYEAGDERLYVALNNGAIDMIAGNKVVPKVGASDTVVNRFLYHSTGQVIVSTDRNGLHQFTKEKLSRPEQLFPHNTFLDLIWLNDSLFMAVEETSLKVFNKKYELFAQEVTDENMVNTETKIYQDSKKRIWAGTIGGLKLLTFLPHKNEPITFAPPPAPFNISLLNHTTIKQIFEDADGIFWFATIGGLVKIKRDGSHQIITVKDGLPSNIVTCIFQDKEKNLWFGTAAGLSKLVTRQSIWLYPIEDGFFENNYSCLLYAFKKNYFLAGTVKGTKIFNTLTGNFAPVVNGNNQQYFDVVINSKPTQLICYYNLAIFDSAKIRYEKIITLPLKYASRIISDKQGNLFLSHAGQLIFMSGKFQQNIIYYRITALLIDKSGDLWAGTWANGLFRIRYNFSNNTFAIIATHQFLPTENIRSLFEDSKGNIWAGTRYQGVYQFTKKERDSFAIVNFDQKKGLTSNFIKRIREDANGNIWIAFYQGLDKIIRSGNSYRIFNFSRVNNYFASIIGMETDEDGILWLATNEGLVKITDGEMEQLPPLPVYITKVFSHDSAYDVNSKKIQLNYRQNQVQFEFSSPGFINEKQLLYSYRLAGSADTAWTIPTNQNMVSYASLSAGSYLFEVRTLGWNGNWGTPAHFEFLIRPPFWQSWWFIAIVSVLISLGIYAFIKWREKNINAIAEERLKVQQLNAGQYKSKLELELIINYFSSSLIGKTTQDDVLWDVANNLIGRLGFVDCMIYLWNTDKTKMIQKAGFGPKGSIEEISRQPFDVAAGMGVVGYVMQTKEAVLIPDTSKDNRYRPDEMIRLSEITVPVIYNNELIGVIDSEHHEKNFFTPQHLHIMSTIATLMANKIKSIEAEELLQRTNFEMYSMNEQLSNAKLEALRSQMNPHFIFNCLNSIDNLIQMDEKEKATLYLSKFAKLIRSILENSAHNTVPCWKDMDTLKLYLELEALRFDHKFSYIINVADEIINGDYKVPPLVIQPFVENAIHHGLLNKIEGEKKLMVKVFVSNNQIFYTIEDNGVGRAKAAAYKQLNKPATQSMGMQITIDRINLFNQQTNGSVKITDLFNERQYPIGTRVEVQLINQP